MTLIRLADILGETIEDIHSLSADQSESSSAEVKFKFGQAESIARLAKQMINNADIVLRANKLVAEGKLHENDTIVRLIEN